MFTRHFKSATRYFAKRNQNRYYVAKRRFYSNRPPSSDNDIPIVIGLLFILYNLYKRNSPPPSGPIATY